MMAELDAAQLSAADIGEDGEVASPAVLRVKIAAYERLTWYGRPGFAVRPPPGGVTEFVSAPQAGATARLIGFQMPMPTLKCPGSEVR